MIKIMIVYGTRPEAIKMAPLILELKRRSDHFQVEVCITGQHREMLDQIDNFFGIEPDYDLALMKPNQTLFDITSACLYGMKEVLGKSKPDFVVVQGDTTTAMATALAAFYLKIPIAHLEAGLRSNEIYSPFPEEANRKLIGQLATIHFAPTGGAAENLAREGMKKNVHIVGNTVIDALLLGNEIVQGGLNESFADKFAFLDFSKSLVLVTGHRRESFGEGFEKICDALRRIAEHSEEVQLVYPVHLNPNVRAQVFERLSGRKNIFLLNPLGYPEMIWLMGHCSIVLTDSGGIQEEAPALGKPVLVMREVTERIEGIQAGTAMLVGTDSEAIFRNAIRLIENADAYQAMARAVNPYGDGNSSSRIADILENLPLPSGRRE